MDLKTLFTPVVDSSLEKEVRSSYVSALDSHFEGVDSRKVRSRSRVRDDSRTLPRRKITPRLKDEDDEGFDVIQLSPSPAFVGSTLRSVEEEPLFSLESIYKISLWENEVLSDYEIRTSLSNIFSEAWDLTGSRAIAEPEAWTDWVHELNELEDPRIESISADNFILYKYKVPEVIEEDKAEVDREVKAGVKAASDSLIDQYTRAIAQLKSTPRRLVLDNLPAHLRRKTLQKIKDARETSESDELAVLISEYILTQEESTLHALLLKRADIDEELRDALDFVLDFPNNELLAEDVTVGTEALVTYFEANETEIPAFELMVSEEAQQKADEEIIKAEEEELKEKTEANDSALDDIIELEEEEEEEEEEERLVEKTAFPPAAIIEEEEEENDDVIQILKEAGIDYIDVNGFIIVKDDAPQTVSERIRHALPEKTEISLPIMSCADYHTIMDTKERRRSLLNKIKDSKSYEGLSDVTKVVNAALHVGDFATADSRFYKRTLADSSWISEPFKKGDVPEFLLPAVKDEAEDAEFSFEISEKELPDAAALAIGNTKYFVKVIKNE